MRAFAALVTQLGYTRSRNAKVALIADYLRATPDPDRGWALAALTGEADFSAVKASAVRAMAMERVDPELFRLSRDFVGDTAETVALIWPETVTPTNDLRLADAVDAFANVSRARAPALLAEYMDRLDSDGRYALIKLATGAMRVGISARLAKTAFAQAFGLDVDAVEEVWHALAPPYASLFAWGDSYITMTWQTVAFVCWSLAFPELLTRDMLGCGGQHHPRQLFHAHPGAGHLCQPADDALRGVAGGSPARHQGRGCQAPPAADLWLRAG